MQYYSIPARHLARSLKASTECFLYAPSSGNAPLLSTWYKH